MCPSVNFRESPDGRNMLVTFDMTGVKKQDMHVSYRTNRLIVSWRVERSVEKQDGDVVVREREVRRYSHTIPLPEGTKFEEVRASRDGQRLTLTLPNSKCVRADTEQVQLESLRTIPDIDVGTFTCELLLP
ncbi:HSP20-like chaperone [Fomes fomentarius]|nr:HSP20-like chaperone [Fomes fomentarius]